MQKLFETALLNTFHIFRWKKIRLEKSICACNTPTTLPDTPRRLWHHNHDNFWTFCSFSLASINDSGGALSHRRPHKEHMRPCALSCNRCLSNLPDVMFSVQQNCLLRFVKACDATTKNGNSNFLRGHRHLLRPAIAQTDPRTAELQTPLCFMGGACVVHNGTRRARSRLAKVIAFMS